MSTLPSTESTTAGTPGGTELGMAAGADPVTAPHPARQGVLGPPESRGRTEIADRVLERIAARAVTETAQAGGAARRLLGLPLGRDAPGSVARVTAHVDGHLAVVKMSLSVTYPAPIRQVTRRVREHVITRVGELTGLDVRQVDIEIAALTSPEQRPRSVL